MVVYLNEHRVKHPIVSRSPVWKKVEGDLEVSSTNDVSVSCDILKHLALLSQYGDDLVNSDFAS